MLRQVVFRIEGGGKGKEGIERESFSGLTYGVRVGLGVEGARGRNDHVLYSERRKGHVDIQLVL